VSQKLLLIGYSAKDCITYSAVEQWFSKVLKALYRLISSTVYYYSNTTCRGYFYKFV